MFGFLEVNAILFRFVDVVKVLEDGDLQTLGMIDYDKRLSHSFTAHPKVDPVTGKSSLFPEKQVTISVDMMTRHGPCRRNVYIRLLAYATLSHIQSDLERWHYA